MLALTELLLTCNHFHSQVKILLFGCVQHVAVMLNYIMDILNNTIYDACIEKVFCLTHYSLTQICYLVVHHETNNNHHTCHFLCAYNKV